MNCPYCKQDVPVKHWAVGIFNCPECKKSVRIEVDNDKLKLIKGV